MQLLLIPVILVIVGSYFSYQQTQTSLQVSQQQHKQDQASALDQQQAIILQTYIDNIQDLLLNHNLLKSKPGVDVATLARARTLNALQGLDPHRKGVLMDFLYEARLIGFYDIESLEKGVPIVILLRADFRQAYFSGIYLYSANLSYANFSNANLSGDVLEEANFSGAHLEGANLSGAVLEGANFGGAHLEGANLSGADFLTQQQLDRVYSCKGAILPKGLTCHHNQ